MVELNLAENQSKAKARIMAGDVIIDDHRQDKPGIKVYRSVSIRLKGNSHPYVGRGGLKLEHAIRLWPFLPIKDTICLDIGASTGGFTEVLLNHGAQKVYAVDVGHNQLHESLRVNPKVINMEKTHILQLNKLPEEPKIAVIDVSFISLEKVLPKAKDLLSHEGYIVALVKPQFEVGRELIHKGGIVKDEMIQKMALQKIIDLALSLGLKILGQSESPILGTKGNKEFLLALKV